VLVYFFHWYIFYFLPLLFFISLLFSDFSFYVRPKKGEQQFCSCPGLKIYQVIDWLYFLILCYIIYHIKVIGILRREALIFIQAQFCNDSILSPAIIK
jgi:hypothetical protein